MKSIGEMKCIQVLITNKCCFKCSNCSESCSHIPDDKKYFMDLETVERAFDTLQDYPGHVGIFGGEPTLHPQFDEVLKLMQKKVWVKSRRELWTAGTLWKKHKELIQETFYPEAISFNDHPNDVECWHQPIHVACKDVFNGEVTGDFAEDTRLMWKCINNCWVQNRWSASVTPYGCWYCEVAGGRAAVLGMEGIKLEKDWWRRPLTDWSYQMNELCRLCGACIPMPLKANSKQGYEDISVSNKDSLKQSSKKLVEYDLETLRSFLRGHTFEPETEFKMRGYFKDFPDWKPNKYRVEHRTAPNE